MTTFGSHPIPPVSFEELYKVANLHGQNISLLVRERQLPSPTVELTGRREIFFLLRFSFCLCFTLPAAPVQRFVGCACEKARHRSVNHFTGKTIATTPKRTLWTSGTIRVVNALFVRTSDNPVDGCDRHHIMFRQKRAYLAGDFIVRPQVTPVGVPPLQEVGFSTFTSDDTDSDFRRVTIVRSIESNRTYWVTPKTLASPFEQRVLVS